MHKLNENADEIIPQFQELMKSSKVGHALASLLLIAQLDPTSLAEAERGFSHMKLTEKQLKVIFEKDLG
jgi:hypothetical protein